MRLESFITEYNEVSVEKLTNSLSDIPSSTPENIAKYIFNNIKSAGIKFDTKNITYLSGPMTNIPDANWPTFMIAERYIGGKVFNPARPHGFIIKKSKAEFTWSDYMIEDIYNLLQCKGVVVLPGWSNSTGAVTEVYIGKKLHHDSVELKKHIGNNKYNNFIESVKERYYRDGNGDGFDSVVYPMLTAKTESEAAKYVKSYSPVKESFVVNEGVIDYIGSIISSLKNTTLLNILRVIGSILDKTHATKIVR